MCRGADGRGWGLWEEPSILKVAGSDTRKSDPSVWSASAGGAEGRLNTDPVASGHNQGQVYSHSINSWAALAYA